MTAPVRIFFSYHERDVEYCDEILKHLRTAERAGRIKIWHRHQLAPGTDVVRAVEKELEDADVIVLLLSADLLASDYCWGVEVSAAVQRHRQNRALLLPLVLRPCAWKDCFPDIRAIPRDESPLLKDSSRAIDASFANAARELLAATAEFEVASADSTRRGEVTSVSAVSQEIAKLEARNSPRKAAAALFRLNALLTPLC